MVGDKQASENFENSKAKRASRRAPPPVDHNDQDTGGDGGQDDLHENVFENPPSDSGGVDVNAGSRQPPPKLPSESSQTLKFGGNETYLAQSIVTLMGFDKNDIRMLRENRQMLRSNNKCDRFPFSRSMSSDLYTIIAALIFQNDLIWEEGPSRPLDPRVPEDLQELIKRNF